MTPHSHHVERDRELRKVLVVLHGAEVAPRFDLASEVWLAVLDSAGELLEEKTLVLPGPSAEGLSTLILGERVDVVVCGGIEEEFYDYLRWKHVQVLDSVIGTLDEVIGALRRDSLRQGAILRQGLGTGD